MACMHQLSESLLLYINRGQKLRMAADVKVASLSVLLELSALLCTPSREVRRRDELFEAHDIYDEGVFCRARAWLFVSYCVSFGAIVGAVWVLLSDYALNPEVSNVWPGVAGLFQVALILGAALLFFVSRTPSEGSGYGQF